MNIGAPPSYTRSRIQNWYEKHKPRSSKTQIRPYLGLKTRATLALLAPLVIGTLFAIVTIAAARPSIDGITGSTITAVNATCQHVQSRAEDALNMPLRAQQKLGQQVQDSTTSIINGLESILLLLLKAIPIVIMFFIDFYRALLLCFLQLVVQAALAAVTELVQLASSAIEDVAHGIGDAVSGAFDLANDAIDGINDVISWTGQSVDRIDAPSLDALTDFQMPSSVQDTLNDVNDNLPDLEDLRNYLEGIISTPFNDLSSDVTDKFDGYKSSANTTNVLASTQAPQSLSLCSDMDLSLVTDLGNTIKKIGLWVIVALSIFAVIYSLILGYFERKRYYRAKEIIDDYEDGNDRKRLAELISSDSNPYVYRWTKRMPALRRDSIRWSALIVSHPYAVTLLSIGAIGLLSTGVQYALVDRIQDSFIERARSAYDATESSLGQTLTTAASGGLSNNTNDAIGSIENTINDDIFGWLDDGVVPINDTLTAFENGLNDAVGTAFNGTFIEDAISNYVQCVVGSKLDALESGLTWIHDNANVNLTRVPDDLFDISTSLSNAMSPLRNAIVGNSSTGEEGIVQKVAEAYKRQLQISLITFGVLLLTYVLVIIVAAVAVTISAFRRRNENDPDDEPQFVFIEGQEPVRLRELGNEVEVSSCGDDKSGMASTPDVTVNPPTPERTTTIVPSPAYSGHSRRISWVYDAEHPELAAIRYSKLDDLNHMADEERRDA